MGCRCNCLAKDQEENHEMIGGIMPGINIIENKKVDLLNEIKNINTEVDIYDKEKIDNSNLDNIKLSNRNEKINEDEDEDQDELNQDKINENRDKLKSTNYRALSSHNSFQKKESYESDSDMSKIQELYESIFEYINDIRTDPETYQEDAEEHGVGDIIKLIINASAPCTSLIINSFYNLLLSAYINNNTSDGEDAEKILAEINKEEKVKNFNKKLFIINGDINNSNEVVWKLIQDNKDIAYETFFSNNVDCLAISCQKTQEKNKFKCYFLILSKL